MIYLSNDHVYDVIQCEICQLLVGILSRLHENLDL